jgi:hypothetical protein
MTSTELGTFNSMCIDSVISRSDTTALLDYAGMLQLLRLLRLLLTVMICALKLVRSYSCTHYEQLLHHLQHCIMFASQSSH